MTLFSFSRCKGTKISFKTQFFPLFSLLHTLQQVFVFKSTAFFTYLFCCNYCNVLIYSKIE